MKENEPFFSDAPYICVKALEKGMNVIGITRGEVTKIHHTEKLDCNEVWIAQFTEHTSAMKVRGKADIYTPYGIIHCGKESESVSLIGRNE